MANKYPLVLNGTSIEELQSDDTLVGVDIVNDTTPQLGGDLDLNSSDITGTGNINITGTATISSNITVGGTVDGRDVATDGTKLDTVETNADVTDATNVNAAGAVMNSDTATTDMSFVVDEDTMSSNSATKLPTQQSVKAYVDTQVASVVDTAPDALNTLNELAAALGDDANFATTTATSLGEKLVKASNLSDLTSASTARTNLGVAIGSDVQAYSSVLANTTASFTTADETKLDGIESGATADQTKADIDALGIDAATLDGVDSTSFLRSDAADTKTSGDLNFSDNVKTNFGDGYDLQIQHDGSHNRIDTLTGNLYIRNFSDDQDIYLQSDDGTGSLTTYVHLDGSEGSVGLHHYGSTKLATTSSGIDVTGNVRSSTGNFGLDSGDYIVWSNNAHLDIAVNAGVRVRVEADGDLHADGDVIAYSTTISDERLKENIQPIDDALEKVKQLKGCTFTYTADGKESAGLIAQDVEKVLPSAVSEKELPLKTDDDKEYKVLQYDQTIGLLVEAIKELSARVEELENK